MSSNIEDPGGYLAVGMSISRIKEAEAERDAAQATLAKYVAQQERDTKVLRDWAANEGKPMPNSYIGDIVTVMSYRIRKQRKENAAALVKLLAAAKLAQVWLSNCVPTVDITGPKPLPVIAEAITEAERATTLTGDELITELRAAGLDAWDNVPLCDFCGKPATCSGTYEQYTGSACDDCCGHGCEDGHCEPIDVGEQRLEDDDG